MTRLDTTAAPVPDLLGRLLDPERPDVAWCGDVTWIPTDEGWLYLASVIDLASRHLLGYSMGAHHDAALVCDALDAAVATRGLKRMPDTIFHSDRGAEGVHLQRLRQRLPAARTSPLDEPHRLVPGQGVGFTLHLLVLVGCGLGWRGGCPCA